MTATSLIVHYKIAGQRHSRIAAGATNEDTRRFAAHLQMLTQGRGTLEWLHIEEWGALFGYAIPSTASCPKAGL